MPRQKYLFPRLEAGLKIKSATNRRRIHMLRQALGAASREYDRVWNRMWCAADAETRAEMRQIIRGIDAATDAAEAIEARISAKKHTTPEWEKPRRS